MPLQTLANSEIKRGTLVRVEGVPGLWRYSHPAGGTILKKREREEAWVEAEDRLAKRYVYSHSCAMLRVVTESVTIVDANQPKGNTNA